MTTSLDSTIALMTAVRSALLADAPLSALITGIYDRAPDKAKGNYLTIGDASSVDWSTATEDGQEHTLDIHVWSQKPSQTAETAEARAILGHIRRVLHNATGLTIAMPFSICTLQITHQIGPYLDPDEKTLHGVATLHAEIDHA